MAAKPGKNRSSRYRRLGFEQLEPRLQLSAVALPVDPEGISVKSGATAIVYNPNALADGCSLMVGTNTGLFGPATGAVGPLVAPGPASASDVVISGGEVDYSSDDIPAGATAVNGGQAVCTDPTNAPNGDLRNAWRSTVTDLSTAGTINTTDSDGNPVTLAMGPMTEYLNRYGQQIAASQAYTETFFDKSTSSGTALAATTFSANTLTSLGADDVTAITPSATQLVVTASDQGTVTTQQYDSNGNLTQQQTTTAGVPQLTINDDGTNTTFTWANQVVTTFPDEIDASDVSIAQPDAVNGPVAKYVVATGNVLNWHNVLAPLGLACPSVAYSQPPGYGGGSNEIYSDGTCHSTVALTGAPPGPDVCNNLVSSTVSDNLGNQCPAGSVEVLITGAAPNSTYSVSYEVNGYVGVGCPNPAIGTNQTASASISDVDGGGTIVTGGSKPTTTTWPAVNSEGSVQTRTVTTDAKGVGLVTIIKFSMQSKSSGQVVACANVKVTQITFVSGPKTQALPVTGPLDGGGETGGASTQPEPIGHAQPGTLVWQRMAAFDAALTALQDTIDPDNVGAHSEDTLFAASGIWIGIIEAVMAENGGTRVGATAEMIENAVTQVLESNGMTVAPASGTPTYVQAEAAAAATDFPSDTTDSSLFFNLVVLNFFANNEITLNV